MLIKILIGYLVVGLIERKIQEVVMTHRLRNRMETPLINAVLSCDESEIDSKLLWVLFAALILCWLSWPIWMVYTIIDEIGIDKERRGN